MKRRGFSDSAIRLASASHRQSTRNVYQSHWSAWLKWSRINHVDPLSPSGREVANHLARLADLGKSASMLRVRCSAVSTTIKQLGHSASGFSQACVSQVIKGVALSNPRPVVKVPAWDLFLVLEALRSPPFEPLASIDFKFLTLKTVFLVALATARRSSELHGLSGKSSDISFNPDGSISLAYLPEFRAKCQDPESASPKVIVRPLSDMVDYEEDLRNCPVRALRRYLSVSKPRRKNYFRRLFIPLLRSGSKDVAKTTVARWISTTVKTAYNLKAKSISKARAHETRAWATTLAADRCLRLASIMEQAYWRSEDVFIRFYLRDVSATTEDGASNISLVACNRSLHF